MKKEDFICDDIDCHEIFFFSQLSECEKRKFVGLEAIKHGYNGVAIVSLKFGVHRHTVRKGKKELFERIIPPSGKIRQKGGGRKKNSISQRID
jgi:hypothetical protein